MKAVAPVDRVNYDALAAAILSTSAGTRYSPSFFYMAVKVLLKQTANDSPSIRMI